MNSSNSSLYRSNGIHQRGNVLSFDGRTDYSQMSNGSTGTGTSSKYQYSGFMQKLDIFNGDFLLYYFTIDQSFSLLCFGPCGPNASEYDYANMTKREAESVLDLKQVYRLRPYDGSIAPPRRHFCFDLYADSAKWSLAVETVDQFAKWVKRFHKISKRLQPVQYNIVHDNYTWSVEQEDSKDKTSNYSNGSGGGGGNDDSKGGESGGKTKKQTSRIKTFKVAVFQETQFGMQLTSCSDGTMVYSITPGGAAERKGICVNDVVVAINEKSVVGMRWRDVKREILIAERPIRITFGKPSKKPSSSSASVTSNTKKSKASGSVGESVSSALALRRRLGPYVYALKQRINGGGGGSAGGGDHYSFSSQPLSLSPGSPPPPNGFFSKKQQTTYNPNFIEMSTMQQAGGGGGGFPMQQRVPPKAPPRNRGGVGGGGGLSKPLNRPGSFLGTIRRGLTIGKGSNSSRYEQTDYQRASMAANAQLSRYRGLQSKLYSAIQQSFEHEQQIEGVVRALVEVPTKKQRNAVSSRLQKVNGTSVHRMHDILEKANSRNMSSTKPRYQQDQQRKDDQNGGIWRIFCKLGEAIYVKIFRERQRVEALMYLARNGELTDREDAFDAILDFASCSRKLSFLIELDIIPLCIESLDKHESIMIVENVAGICWNLTDEPDAAVELLGRGIVPRLLKLLAAESDDEKSSDIAKEESAGCLWSLCESYDCKADFLKHDGIEIVLQLIAEASQSTEFTMENCTGILWLLSHEPECLDELMKSKKKKPDPIKCFTRLITRGTVVSQENSSGSIMRITLVPRYAERVKKNNDTITALVQVLAFGTVLSREHGAGALHNIALNDDKIQRLIAAEGAITPLSRLLQPQIPASARSRAALCLRTLAQNQENKKEISDLGCINLLVKALKENKEQMVQIHVLEALWGLGHESDQNKILISNSGVLPKLVTILKHGDEEAKARAAGMIATLAENKTNAEMIVNSGALDPLIRMLGQEENGQGEMVQQPPQAAAKRATHYKKTESQREAATALGNLSRGPKTTQSKLMAKLQHGKVIGDNVQDIQSVRAKLSEIELNQELGDDDYF